MFKLAVFSVLVAVAIAKPSVYYSSPLAYSAPVVAAPSSVSSHSKTDYHNENSHSVVGGGVAAVAAEPVVASVGAVPDPSTDQQYPIEIHSAPLVVPPLSSFSNYSRTESSNEYSQSESVIDPAAPLTSSLVSEQLPVVEIKSPNYVANVPEIAVSSSSSPASLNYLPPVPQNIAVPNVYINNEAIANAVEITPETTTDESVIVPSSTPPLAIAEFLPSLPESIEQSSESVTVNEVSTENSVLKETVDIVEPTVTVIEDLGIEQITTTVNPVVIESGYGKTAETANVTFSATSFNTPTPSLVPAYGTQNDLVDVNINVSQSPVNEVVVDSFVLNEPLRPLQNVQSKIEDINGDSSSLAHTTKTVAADYSLPQDVPSGYVPYEPQSSKFLSASLIENKSEHSHFLVQTPKTVITDYNLPQDGPSVYISYISDNEPQNNSSVSSFPASFIDSYTEIEKQVVLPSSVTFDLVSRPQSFIPVEAASEPSKVLISAEYVPSSPSEVSQYINIISSTPLPDTQNDKHIISTIDADVKNLEERLQQTFPDVVSVEADNSAVNIVPPSKYITSKIDTDVNNLKESLKQTFPDVVSDQVDNSAVNLVPSVVSTVPSIISSSKTNYGHEVSQHWIGTPATPVQLGEPILDSSLIQSPVSFKTFNRINCTDETHQSVSPLVENVDLTLLSHDSVPVSIPVSSLSSYNKTDYSNETSFTFTPLGAVASNVADTSFGPASVAYSSPVEVAPGSSVSSSSRTDYHHEASRTDVGAGAVAVDQPVVAAYRAAPVAYSSAPVAVAGSPAASVSSHTKTDYHHENSQHAVGAGAPVAAVRASPVVYSAAPVAYSAAPAAVAASPASSVSSHTKTDYHHEDSRHQQLGSGAAVAAVRASPVAYSAPAVAYSAPAVTYSAPAVAYSAPAVAYSAPAVSYSSPVVVRKVAVAAPSYLNEVSYTPSVYARRVYSSPAVAYASSPYVSYSSPVAYAAGPASSSSSSIRTGGYHHEDHQQNVY
ncbi:uncharacterized protein LOC108735194 isoform X1 [Agrilus planipennis]|uniref:Uncharacterized protein LOC108735194 isoform X1 n=1 Tax=Agrilus planipennis TaxID=224129 RepID=A0A1W4WF33_AGRPL|nr:uncharacterized protein LOC108735194 isoform X1 [Agrilus planipennis]